MDVLSLNDEQVASYEENGFVVSAPVFDETELVALRAAADELLTNAGPLVPGNLRVAIETETLDGKSMAAIGKQLEEARIHQLGRIYKESIPEMRAARNPEVSDEEIDNFILASCRFLRGKIRAGRRDRMRGSSRGARLRSRGLASLLPPDSS